VATAAKVEAPEDVTKSIGSLEERVMQAVSLIAELREERDALRAELTAARMRVAEVERTFGGVDLDAMRREADVLRRENAALARERGDVLQRIDTLVERLGQLATT
jgi:chromosome segregation ATPase